MAYAPERFIGAQRSLLETSQSIGIRGLEGAGQLLELNMQATRALFSAGSRQMSGLSPSALSGGSREGMSSALQADSAALTSYAVRLMEIVSSTNGEIARLLQQQATQMQSLVNEMMADTLRNAPGDGGSMLSMMNAPFGAMQRAAGQAARQAVDAAAQAAGTATQNGEALARSTIAKANEAGTSHTPRTHKPKE